MSRDGSGNYSLPAGQPVVSGSVISASTFNALTSDIATELTDSLSRSGKGAASANLSMGSNRLTSLANGTARTDAANLGQVQDNAAAWLTSIVGTANAIQASATPAIPAYAAGQVFNFVPASTNTGATTLQINGIAGPKDVFAFGAACVGGELVAGTPVSVAYDGTRFHLLAQPLVARRGAACALMETETASNSPTLDFSLDLTNYARHVIHVNNLKPVTDGAEFWGRVSSDGVTYATTAYRWSRHNLTDAATEGLAGSTNDAKFLMANAVGNQDGEQVSGTIEIASVGGMGVRVSWRLSGENASSSYYMINGMGAYAAAASTYFRLMFSTGNISAGSARMYGFRV
jgi:hypothetical protein